MKKKEIAEAMLELGAHCDAVKEAKAFHKGGGESVDLTLFFAGIAEGCGMAYLALTDQIGPGELEPTVAMGAMAEHYLTELDGGADHE